MEKLLWGPVALLEAGLEAWRLHRSPRGLIGGLGSSWRLAGNLLVDKVVGLNHVE